MLDIPAYEAKKYGLVDACYYAAFAIYSFFHLMESTNYHSFLGGSMDSASTIATGLMLILLLPRLLVQQFDGKSIFKVAIILVAGLAVFFMTRSWICLCIGLFICAGRKIRIDPLLWILLLNSAAVFLITYVGMKTGMIETFVTSRFGETRVRNSLGFAQVNSVGFIAARVCTAIVVLRRNKSPWFGVICCVILAGLVEVVANSRTSEFYMLALAFVSVVLWSRGLKEGLNMKSVARASLFLLLGFFFVTVFFMAFFNPGNEAEMQLSRLLTNRLYSMWYFAQNYHITLFGNSQAVYTTGTIWTGDSNAALTIDNGWASWLIRYGIIPTFLLLAGLIALFRKSERCSSAAAYPLIALALMCSLFAFCESSALAIDANPLLVLLACVVYGDSVETMIRGKK